MVRRISFDNIGAAFLTIFQVLTKASWCDIMYACPHEATRLFFLLRLKVV
jgi:hypothetical protein